MTNRTVTLPTLDHGIITIPEPLWCTGHDGHPTLERGDLSHTGPFTNFDMPTSRGEITTMLAALETRPFAPRFRGPHIWVGMEGDGFPSNPEQLDAMAAALVEHAGTLRRLAAELDQLLGGER